MKNPVKDSISLLTKTERKSLICFVLVNTCMAFFDLISIAGVLVIIKFYTSSESIFLTHPYLVKLLPAKNSLLPIILLLLLFCIKNLLGYQINKKQFNIFSMISVRISKTKLEQYLYGDYGNFSQQDSAIYVKQIIHQPTEFAHYVLQSFLQIATELILVCTFAVALSIYKFNLFFIVLLTVIPAIIILTILTRKRIRKIKEHLKLTSELSYQYIQESLLGYVESNIYNLNNFFIDRHGFIQKKLSGFTTSLQSTQDIPARIFEVFLILALFILIIVLRWTDELDIILIGAFIAAAYKIIPGIAKIINLLTQSRAYYYTIEALKSIPTTSTQTKNKITAQKINSVYVRDCGFYYSSKELFCNLNFQFHAGEVIGMYGRSGTGKSTLLNMILGLLVTQVGEIQINNQPLNTYNKYDYWRRIAYVKQENFLMHDTLLNNITLFTEKPNKQRLDLALKCSGLTDILHEFPKGLNSVIMQSGKNISGGQKQRIALARAFYKDADFLLLDEALNELDESSAVSILKNLNQLAKTGKIILVISHQKDHASYFDKVFTID